MSLALVLLAIVTVPVVGIWWIDRDRRRRGEFTPPRIHDDQRSWIKFGQAIDKERSAR